MIWLHVSWKNGLKQGDVLLPLLFNFALKCAIRRVQADQEGLKLIGTHQLLFYNDYLHVLGASKENTEASVCISNEIGLELNDEKTKYMVMSRDQHAVQNHNIYIGNKSFEKVEYFTYLGTSLMNHNSFHEEIKCRLQSGNTCYYLGAESFIFQFAVQKYKGPHIWTYNFAFCFVWVCYLVSHSERGTQAEGVREQGTEEGNWAYEGSGNWESGEDDIMRHFMICTHQIFG